MFMALMLSRLLSCFYYSKNRKPAQVPMVAALISCSLLSENKNFRSALFGKGVWGKPFQRRWFIIAEGSILSGAATRKLPEAIVKQLVEERCLPYCLLLVRFDTFDPKEAVLLKNCNTHMRSVVYKNFDNHCPRKGLQNTVGGFF